ncbi:hypothetical protein CDL12_18793 [Handroanthus impetiginosus]|uniref:Uncharacterized protein n=1 Tax=Handroanthus impetiginosus TaxID=429701 RepID=A0A2G9GTU0_9LAMI|nr:hypothetical protein CDL12_18793 [Handroanthus impetiginosus]
MAVSNSGSHFRSISLPSRLQPIIEHELQKLKSLQISTSFSQKVSITSNAIKPSLLELAELYNSAQFSSTKTSRFDLDQSLEGSITLLDSCSDVRELVVMMKQNVQALQSALRRKGCDSSIQNDIATYSCFRKRINKLIAKNLKELKNLENKNGSSLFGLTIAVFKCILVSFSWPFSRPRGWNLVSRMMMTKLGGFRTEDSMHFAVRNLEWRIRYNGLDVDDVRILQRDLENLGACVEELEGGLKKLFRDLVRCRVLLLNVLTDQLS